MSTEHSLFAFLKLSFQTQCSNPLSISVNMHSAAINGHPNMKRCHYYSPNVPEKDRVSMRAVTQQFTSIRLAIDKSAREEFHNG